MVIERKRTRYIALNEHGEIEYRNRRGEIVCWAGWSKDAKDCFKKLAKTIVWSNDEEFEGVNYVEQ